MKNLYIDFDGVIVNTIDITYQMANERGIKKDYTNYLQFFQTLDWNIILNKCEPLNDSYNEIKKIIASGKFNVSILTHVTSIHEAEAKINHINKYFKDMTIITVPKSVPKTKVVNTEDSILIDDYVYNLDEWKKEGGIGIRFNTNLEGKGYSVINHLSQVLKMF